MKQRIDDINKRLDTNTHDNCIVRVDATLYDAVEKLSKRIGVSAKDIASTAISLFLERNEMEIIDLIITRGTESYKRKLRTKIMRHKKSTEENV